MPERRNIFLHGLSLTLRRFPALLWAYAFNLGLSLLFTLRLHADLASLLDHSLASQRLVGGFDLGTLAETALRHHETFGNPTSGAHTGILVYLAVYFLLVPGTLLCYQTGSPARLSTLLHQGILHFWRFFRITLLTLLISGLILGPLFFLQMKWVEHVDNHAAGLPAFLAILFGYILLFLIASILRLYFDLVEVYTVQLGLHHRRSGKPDARVRRTLRPAWRIFRAYFAEAWPIFLFLTLLGAAAVVLTARISMHMLAQPRVWPTFLLAQLGLFLLLLTRFWQRGVETSLALQNPLYPPPELPIRPVVTHVPPVPQTAPVADLSDSIEDPIPNPEPAPPSLDEPDLGIYHRNHEK